MSAAERQAHRGDIDGLRAIAVLAVIVFHINPEIVPGGFVGVDIFFVISGYLITGHIAEELAAGRFSLVEFYRRRVKRIAPAMMLVVATTLLVGLALLLPEDMLALGKSAVWSLASLANVYFWREVASDYFAPASETLPLLHLWSLGVEEQFYLLWPLVMMALWKFSAAPRKLALALALLLVPLSCVLTAWGFDRDPMFVYYMLPTRAGELSLGAALALFEGQGPGRWRPGPRWADAFALGGLAAIVASLALLREGPAFPGWRSLGPTVGAALLIAAGTIAPRHLLSSVLSIRPFAWIGAVSYSAYLWHWPVLAFWRYLYGQPEWPMQLAALALTLLLAGLSYYAVEQPARKSRQGAAVLLLKMYLLPAGLQAALSLALVFGPTAGLLWSEPGYVERLQDLRAQVQPAYREPWVCQRTRLQPRDLVDQSCVLGAPQNGPVRVLLWGDSNASHYIPMLEQFAESSGYRFRNLAVSSCPPLLGDPQPFVDAPRLADCLASLAQVKRVLANYRVIVLGGSWTDYLDESPGFATALEETVAHLRSDGHQVVLLGKVPVFPDYDRQCEEKALRLPWLDCRMPDMPLLPEVAAANAALRQIAARHPGTSYFDATPRICPGGLCSLKGPDGVARYFDPGHLSVTGSAELGEAFVAEGGVPAALDLADPGESP